MTLTAAGGEDMTEGFDASERGLRARKCCLVLRQVKAVVREWCGWVLEGITLAGSSRRLQ